MTEPRDGRRKRKATKPEAAVPAATGAELVSRWSREPRPLLPPLKVGREWEQVRRIAYL